MTTTASLSAPPDPLAPTANRPLVLPLDLLENVIDNLRNDTSGLCTFALVSKQALRRSRSHLVSKVTFAPSLKSQPNDGLYRSGGLSTLLPLLDVPWTSFSDCLEEICFSDYSWSHSSDGLSNLSSEHDYRRIASNLNSLKTLSVFAAIWFSIPDEIQYLFSLCNLEELRLDECLLEKKSTVSNFLSWIGGPSVKRLSFRDTFARTGFHITAPPKCWHFSRCDNGSLHSLLKVGAIPVSDDPDITIQIEELNLHVRLFGSRVELHSPLLRLLQRFGMSVKKVAVIMDSSGFPKNLVASDITERNRELLFLENCRNIEALHIGNLSLMPKHGLSNQQQAQQTVDIIQELFRVHPKDSLSRIFLTFHPGRSVQVAVFPWEELILHLRHHCSNLRRVLIRYCTEESGEAYLEAMRQAGLQRFEEEGLVSLQVYNPALKGKPKPGLYKVILPHSLEFFED